MASSAQHINEIGPPYRSQAGGVGQLGMAHRLDGPASSLRMFGHVHWAMCGGGCQFEVLEEHACT